MFIDILSSYAQMNGIFLLLMSWIRGWAVVPKDAEAERRLGLMQLSEVTVKMRRKTHVLLLQAFLFSEGVKSFASQTTKSARIAAVSCQRDLF